MRLTVSLSLCLSLLAFGCAEAEEPITRAEDLPRLPTGDEGEAAHGGAGNAAVEDGVAHAQDRRRPPPPPPQPTPPAQATGTDPQAPATYTVRLNTTKGPILLDVTRAWSPNGADRFHRLVSDGYYTDVAFFRVIQGFMAQTGIHGDPAVAAQWRGRNIPDDPVRESNRRGYVSYAMAGPGSRTTQFFINLVDNQRLDGMGFAPFARVRPESMRVVDQLHAGYGEGAPRGRGPAQQRMQSEGNRYLRAEFPDLDYIRSAEIVP